MLTIDTTLFIQIGNFLLLLLLLNILLYRPIRRILSKRAEEILSLQEMIQDYQNQAEQRANRIEEAIALARKQGLKEREGFKGQGLEEEKGILHQASSSVEEKMAKARADLEATMADARSSLEGQVTVFSKQLAEKILGRGIR